MLGAHLECFRLCTGAEGIESKYLHNMESIHIWRLSLYYDDMIYFSNFVQLDDREYGYLCPVSIKKTRKNSKRSFSNKHNKNSNYFPKVVINPCKLFKHKNTERHYRKNNKLVS